MIKVVITTTLTCTEDQFHGEEMNELLNDVRTGKMSRQLKKGPVSDATVTYWTDYKIKNNREDCK